MSDSNYGNEFWEWVNANKDADPTRLRLRKNGKPAWIDDAISHIENVKKGKKKFQHDEEISGTLPRLMPIAISVEQATSTQIARIHRDLAVELMPGKRTVLDMTCGLGIDTALLSTIPDCHVTSIERNDKIAAVAKENFKDNSNVTIVKADSVDFLENSEIHYNLIFIDPARRDTAGQRVFNIRDCSPNVCDILPVLKSKSDAIMIKLSPMLDITQTIKDLPGVNRIYVIEQNGECRELLAIFDNSLINDPEIHVIADNKQFTFTKSDEEAATETYDMPEKDRILLEPSAGMMKAAPFKLLSERLAIPAIHSNTHIYVSKDYIPDFIGRQNRIIEVLPFSSGNLKRLSKLRLSADVAVRNFPLTAEQLRNRLGIKKSGTERFMGVTAVDGKQYLLRTCTIDESHN